MSILSPSYQGDATRTASGARHEGCHPRSGRLVALLACSWLAAATASAAITSPATEPPAVVPDAIKVQPTESLSFAARARGVQIYRCVASEDETRRFEWVLVAPDADLFDRNGKRIGRHYAGPTWASNDGSKVVGEVVGHADAEDPGAIPWLLLVAKRHHGSGAFSRVTSITRVDTAGGRAPAAGCDQTSAGKKLRVPYTATYRFYVAER